MGRKSNADLNNELAAVYEDMSQRQGNKAHPTASAEEAKKRAKEGNTRGKKGAKMPTINMRFKEENFEYLQVMSGLKGISATAFCNEIIEQHREKNAETFAQAQELARSIK